MTEYRPCRECGLPAEVTDGWVWDRDGTTTTYYDAECPVCGRRDHGLTDRGVS